MLNKAKERQNQIVPIMRDSGAPQLADALDSGTYPENEEMIFFARFLHCSVLVNPRNRSDIAFRVGDLPVEMDMDLVHPGVESISGTHYSTYPTLYPYGAKGGQKQQVGCKRQGDM